MAKVPALICQCGWGEGVVGDVMAIAKIMFSKWFRRDVIKRFQIKKRKQNGNILPKMVIFCHQTS